MRNVAAGLIIVAFGFYLILAVILLLWPDARWGIRRSPKTGICYELRVDYSFLGESLAMSAVGDAFCEDRP